MKINYPIAKRQRQGNAPRMEPASATEIMKGEQRDDGSAGRRKVKTFSGEVVWRGDSRGWKQQQTVEGKPQAACASGKCLRPAQG